jgi:uncharacterized membrane protein
VRRNLETEKMKKTATYYFGVLAALNALAAVVMSSMNGNIALVYARLFEGKPYPAITNMVFECPWWPYIFCVLCLAGCAMSIFSKIRDDSLCHIVILSLATELVLVFMVMLGYLLPIYDAVNHFKQ